MKLVAAIAVILATFAFSVTAFAQVTTATIYGTTHRILREQ
jgi:hypothetical protein